MRSSAVDCYLFGEGEVLFKTLLAEDAPWEEGAGSAAADEWFRRGHNPYAAGLLEPEIEDMVLIETQRGCPHACGYCHYGTSRRTIGTVSPDRVVEAIAWARDRAVAEAYLLDPCLNARRDLDTLLAPHAPDLPALTFADPAAQKHWIASTQAHDYWLRLIPDR